MSFEQCDDGTMTVQVYGPHHCGPDESSPKTFRWAVHSEWPDGSLDSEGFLLDNLSYRMFFKTIERTKLSCEELAEFCAFRLTDLAAGRPDWVAVTLWPVPDGDVNVTARLTRDEYRASLRA